MRRLLRCLSGLCWAGIIVLATRPAYASVTSLETGQTEITGPQDLYFEITEATAFTVRTWAQQYGIDSMLWLYGSDGLLIAANDDYYGLDSYIAVALSPGTYRLRTGVCCGNPDAWYGTHYFIESNSSPVSTTTTTSTEVTTTTQVVETTTSLVEETTTTLETVAPTSTEVEATTTTAVEVTTTTTTEPQTTTTSEPEASTTTEPEITTTTEGIPATTESPATTQGPPTTAKNKGDDTKESEPPTTQPEETSPPSSQPTDTQPEEEQPVDSPPPATLGPENPTVEDLDEAQPAVEDSGPTEENTETEGEQTVSAPQGSDQESSEPVDEDGQTEQDLVPLSADDLNDLSPAAIVNSLRPEVLDSLTPEQADGLIAGIAEAELTDEQAEAIAVALSAAPESVKAVFEEEINIFGGQFDSYVPIGSAITVGQRRAVVAAGAVVAAAGATTTTSRRKET